MSTSTAKKAKIDVDTSQISDANTQQIFDQHLSEIKNDTLLEYSLRGRDKMKLEDGNTIYVDMSYMLPFSKTLRELHAPNDKMLDKKEEIIYKGNVYTYRLIYQILRTYNVKQSDYISNNINNLNGTTIVIIMEWLQIHKSIITDTLRELLNIKELKWSPNIPSMYIQTILALTMHYTSGYGPRLVIINQHVIEQLKLQESAYYHLIQIAR